MIEFFNENNILSKCKICDSSIQQCYKPQQEDILRYMCVNSDHYLVNYADIDNKLLLFRERFIFDFYKIEKYYYAPPSFKPEIHVIDNRTGQLLFKCSNFDFDPKNQLTLNDRIEKMLVFI